jgi:hypothetical protein
MCMHMCANIYWQCGTDTKTDKQWNTTWSLEMNSCIYGNLVDVRDDTVGCWEKINHAETINDHIKK